MHYSELLPGDIVLDKEHTMIAVGEGYIVDAWGKNKNKGVMKWHWSEADAEDRTTKPQSVFRADEAGVRQPAAQFASAWALTPAPTLIAPWRNDQSKRWLGTKTTTERGTTFKTEQNEVVLDDRRWGVHMTQLESGVAPPFNFDALRRALKYSLRMERPFSYNRGTTCCAFVVFCHQAAALARVAEPTLRQQLLNRLTEERSPKRLDLPFTPGTTIKKPGYVVSPLATRAGANPGFKGNKTHAAEKVDLYLEDLAKELASSNTATWTSILSPELLVDAQFIHSGRLLTRLAGNEKPKAWTCVLDNGKIAA